MREGGTAFARQKTKTNKMGKNSRTMLELDENACLDGDGDERAVELDASWREGDGESEDEKSERRGREEGRGEDARKLRCSCQNSDLFIPRSMVRALEGSDC